MAGAMDSVDDLARTGFFMTCGSAPLIPAAWACAGQMYPMLGDPGELFDAGMEWLDAAQQIQEALNANMELTNSLGATGWQGTDYDAFVEKAADLSRQLMATMSLAYVVGTAMIVAAMALLVVSLVIFAIGVGMAIYATAILAAMASVVGFLGPVEALMATANTWAGTCAANLITLDKTMMTLFNVMAGTVGAALALDVGAQVAFGNDEALGDLAQATVLGVPTIASGLASAFFAKWIGGKMALPGGDPFRALGIGIQGTGVDPIEVGTEHIDPSRW